MADIKETLKSLLLSHNVTDEATANKYVENLDPAAAQRLIDIISGGPSKNLEGGKGGFLAGLRNVVETRKTDKLNEFPYNPKELSESEKKAAIEGYLEEREKSDSKFAEGLKLLLDARAEEDTDRFKRWAVELSDEDFPVHMHAYEKDVKESNEEFMKKIIKKYEEERLAADEILKKHRNENTI